MPKSTLHEVKEGETLQDLSTRYYGVPSNYLRIANANPSVAAAFYEIFPGQILNIPPREVLNPQLEKVDNFEDNVFIGIDGVTFRNFSGFKLKRSISVAADTFSFEIPWDENNALLKKTFKPFQFNVVQIYIGQDLVFTGTLINCNPKTTDKSKVLVVSGYSTCGVLNDCHYPVSAGSPVFDTGTLENICRTLASAFDIKVINFTVDSYVFEELDIKRTDKVYSFMSKLAKKRGVLLTSNKDGNLIIQQTTTSKARFTFEEGEPDILSIVANYAGQKAYSSFTGVLDAKEDDAPLGNDSVTVQDPFIFQDVVRPFVFEIDEVQEGSLEEATEALMRRTWAKRISYNLTVKGWRDPKGNLWEENIRINVLYPSVMIYKTTEFLIESVEFLKDASSKIVKMVIVLPQCYNNDPLETLPWLDEED